MVQVSFRAPTEKDILELVSKLAEDDRKEILIQGVEVEWAIRHSVEASEEVLAIFADEVLACFVGITVEDGLVPSATPWLLGTKTMQAYPKKVLYYSKWLVRKWSKVHPFMVNYVDARHERAINWLKHLGADFEEIPEYGPYKKPFFRFTFGVDPCASQ
jgi:hypothetical protein